MLLETTEEEDFQPQKESAGTAQLCWTGSAVSAGAKGLGWLLISEPWVEGSGAGGGPAAATTSVPNSRSMQGGPRNTKESPTHYMSGMFGNGINPAIGGNVGRHKQF